MRCRGYFLAVMVKMCEAGCHIFGGSLLRLYQFTPPSAPAFWIFLYEHPKG